MRIKRLELIGFKSSMQRTVLDFPDGITGIVGPNGCGKSNIVDALRWVLGEQSAKHLRGQAMEDIIFAGNQTYAPLGACEVTVVFDNEDGGASADPEADAEASELVRALRQAPELSVSRKLYRSGESQYLLNGKICRLRDITELFLGTGLGTKAYSIIEQGRVGQIVSAKPEELRVFIEEAAGTTLYRSRKLAAERKMERTRDNLLRVGDVLRELDRQAGSLRRQAQGAIRYQELKKRETALDTRLCAERLTKLDAELLEVSHRLAATRGRAQAAALAGDAAGRRRTLQREAARTIEKQASGIRSDLYDVRSRIEATARERGYLESRIEELTAAAAEAEAEVAQLVGRREGLDTERAVMAGRRGALRDQLERAGTARKELETTAREHERAIMDWSTESEQTKSEIVRTLAERADVRNAKAAVESRLRGEEERIERLQGERGSLDVVAKRLVDEVTSCQQRLDTVIGTLTETEGGKSTAAEALQGAMARKREAERDFSGAREEAGALKSRYDSLLELHEAFAGYGDGVRAFMSNGGRERTGAKAVLADVIEIDQGYERAVAAVLQDQLQYVVVPDSEAGVQGAVYLRETGAGRASFIPLAPRSGSGATPVPPGYSLLAEHLRVEDGYEKVVAPFLDGVVVAEDLTQATSQWKANGYHATFVTTEGEVIAASGVVTGGSGRPLDAGILERKAELRQLSEALAHAQRRSRETQEFLDTALANAEAAGEELSGLDARVHELTVERVSAEGELELRRQNLVRTEERVGSVEEEMSELRSGAAAARTRLDEIETRLADCGRRLEEMEATHASQEQQGLRLEDERRALVDRLESGRSVEQELRHKAEALELQIRTNENAAAELDARRAAGQDRVTRSRVEIERAVERLEGPELNTSLLTERREALGGELAQLEAAEAEARQAVEQADEAREHLVRRAEALRRESGALEVRHKERELERSALLEGVVERLDLDADGLLRAQCATEQGQAEADCETDAEPWDAKAADRELREIRSKLHRLGAVNLGAVVELEEIEARLSELGGQRDDLERSIEDLRGTIARLNKLSKQRFKETFDDVNRVFREVFPRLFQGGKAELALTDESDLLETGVEINVQPPGKKLGNLNLLSGGEKAMTAISLIFSLFLHKPSPFCVLDEVDAPLDEANIGRFAAIVADMSQRSQFLLITHNKRTMECCRRLYGVTMPEPGVTRIVSVDLEDAEQHAAA